MLKPQDILVALKLVVADDDPLYKDLASSLGISATETHAALRRAAQSGLVSTSGKRPVRRAIEEFVVHGLKYVFPPVRGGMDRGLATGYSAPPLRDKLVSADSVPLVWPDAHGNTNGETLEPLYPSVPLAARKDARLYELLVLVDGIRAGRPREAKIAEELFRKAMK